MKKTMSIAAIALMMSGTYALAGGSCGSDSKSADKDKSKCGTSCSSEKKQMACGGSKKGDQEQKTACGGSSHKHDKTKKAV